MSATTIICRHGGRRTLRIAEGLEAVSFRRLAARREPPFAGDSPGRAAVPAADERLPAA